LLTKSAQAKEKTEIGSVKEAAELIRGEYLVNNDGQQPTSRYIIEKLIQQGKIASSNVTDYGDETGIGKISIKESQIDIIGSLNREYRVVYDSEDTCFYLAKVDNPNLPTVFGQVYLGKNNNRIDLNGYVQGWEYGGEYLPVISSNSLEANNLVTYDESFNIIFTKDGIEYSMSMEIPRYFVVDSNASLELKDKTILADYYPISVIYDSAYVMKNNEKINISSYIESGPGYTINGVDYDSSSINMSILISNGIITEGQTYKFILVKDGKEYEIIVVAHQGKPA